MNKLIYSIVIFIGFSNNCMADPKWIQSAEEITIEYLQDMASRTGYTDHIPHFRKIFENYKVRDFLEFGLGFSTKYFLDHCEKVISVEFVTNGCGPDWIKECIKIFAGCPNWEPIAYFSDYRGDPSWSKHSFFGSDQVYKAASFQCSHHRTYPFVDNAYMVELDSFISSLIQKNHIDIAFVDAGVYIRGDLVQLLFNKVPVIVAHDARCRAQGEKEDVYAYYRILPPNNYEEMFIDAGNGTMVWIEKSDELAPVREALKEYIHQAKWDEGWK